MDRLDPVCICAKRATHSYCGYVCRPIAITALTINNKKETWQICGLKREQRHEVTWRRIRLHEVCYFYSPHMAFPDLLSTSLLCLLSLSLSLTSLYLSYNQACGCTHTTVRGDTGWRVHKTFNDLLYAILLR